MGFIKAFAGALGGAFADQWKDFLVPRPDITGTTAMFHGAPQGTSTCGNERYLLQIIVPEYKVEMFGTANGC